ncbi:hypothetical protein Hamer_G004200 [Homarus americanus]|uniref:Uncharacterized protein n=1 Tax=Homarus americanus TaxID=6706 RepID=A0A8J5JL82_HOMAM|nr:hypothetical protein Hamer_G004200 [Homarus americanus]
MVAVRSVAVSSGGSGSQVSMAVVVLRLVSGGGSGVADIDYEVTVTECRIDLRLT